MTSCFQNISIQRYSTKEAASNKINCCFWPFARFSNCIGLDRRVRGRQILVNARKCHTFAFIPMLCKLFLWKGMVSSRSNVFSHSHDGLWYSRINMRGTIPRWRCTAADAPLFWTCSCQFEPFNDISLLATHHRLTGPCVHSFFLKIKRLLSVPSLYGRYLACVYSLPITFNSYCWEWIPTSSKKPLHQQ